MDSAIYAPVVIPTLNRFEHLRNCIESLKRCSGADQTEVIISLDYPPSEKYIEGYNKIKCYLPTIKGFKKVIVLETERNLGAVENCFKLYDYAKKIGYNRCIFTEDDNVFSPNFLEFINHGLNDYENNPSVMAICGFIHPNVQRYSCNRFMGDIFSAWGVGMWFEKQFTYQKMGSDAYLYAILKSWKKSIRLFRLRPRSLEGFLSMHFNKKFYGDVFKTAELLLENKWCIVPSVTKVRNCGHDGSGVNCGKIFSDMFINQEIDSEKHFEDKNIHLIKQRIAREIKVSFLLKLAILMRYFFYRILNKDIFKYYHSIKKYLKNK